MARSHLLPVFAVLLISTSCFASSHSGQIRFNRDVRPILAENCFHCHGADPASRKAKLRLDQEDGFFKERQDGPTVVKGKPDKSPLYLRIISKDPEELMPPAESHKTLKPEQKELIRRWIAQGAQWEPHWSFIKPTLPDEPKSKGGKWITNPIDNFVAAKLDAVGLKPAPEADRRTLARRVSLDITGLPPEPELVEEFVNDKSKDAYEKLVDKLMASPRYGEHRARYWLDAARYGDTHGLHFDNYREIWPYRDWVINAFNKNQPFDQFTIEQLAGDLLPNPTKEQIIATGFHRCNITTNEGGTIAEENLANYARDRVETTSWVWLGLTANCAVCHDHKFDPITSKDFYSMSAFFRNTTQGALDGNIRDTAPAMVLPKPEDEKRWNEIPQELVDTNKLIAEKRKMLRGDFDKWLEAAKPIDWDAIVEKNGPPALLLPLNVEQNGDQVDGIANGATITVKSSQKIAWADGKSGKAPIIADKAPLTVPGEAGNFERDQAFSYGCWVRLPKDFKGSAAIMARMDDQADFRGWDLMAQDGEYAVHLVSKWKDDAIKVITQDRRAKNDTWQHVFVTYNGSGKASGFKIYVDGKEAKLKVDTNTLKDKSSAKTPTPLLIGQRKTTLPLTGALVQDVRIYPRKLEGYEVLRLQALPKMRTVLGQELKARQNKDKDELFDAYVSDNADLLSASQKVTALEAERKKIRDRASVAHIMEEKRDSMPTANILMRGDYSKPGEKVEAAVFSALHPFPAGAPKNRLGLAQWIVSPENPLTARVIVNRIWQEIFGTGLVKTAEDFGIMGELPSHPELLDYLAAEYRDGGWDTKKLIKQILMSSTYRQAAVVKKKNLEKDAAGRLLSRGSRFRMDAEMIRDYALAASGLLSSNIGGPSVKPYQPENVWEVVGMPGSDTRNYKRDTGDKLFRRSLYTFWKRAAPPASLEILNAPSREFSCVRRERTNTPLQALVTLNDPQFVEAARVLAQNAMKAGSDAEKRLDFIARRVLCRPLESKEAQVVLKIQQELLAEYKAAPENAKKLLSVGEIKADESLAADELAAWTMVCNQMLNLDEVLNK
ncbi:MAG TPA: DUF1553 domain-containing protein [Planctomycetota bacterium]|nr:DUF1553 domain-containing protein [Planctomycetota bacterium]